MPDFGLQIEFANQDGFKGALTDLEVIFNRLEKRGQSTVELLSGIEARLRGFSSALGGSASSTSGFLGVFNQFNDSLKNAKLEKAATALSAMVEPAGKVASSLKQIIRTIDTGGVTATSNFATTITSVSTALGAADFAPLARRLTKAAEALPGVITATKRLVKGLGEFSTLNTAAIPEALNKIFESLKFSNSGAVLAETAQLQTALNNLSETIRAFFENIKKISSGFDTKVVDNITKVADSLKNLRKLNFDKSVESIGAGAAALSTSIKQLNPGDFTILEFVTRQIKEFVNETAALKTTGFSRTVGSISTAFERFRKLLDLLANLPVTTLTVTNSLRSFVQNIQSIDLSTFSAAFKSAALTDVQEKLRNFSTTVASSVSKLENLKKALGDLSAGTANLRLADSTGAVENLTKLSDAINNTLSGSRRSPVFVKIIKDLADGIAGLKVVDQAALDSIRSALTTVTDLFNNIKLPKGKGDGFGLLASQVKSLGGIATSIASVVNIPHLNVDGILQTIQSLVQVSSYADKLFSRVQSGNIFSRIFGAFTAKSGFLSTIFPQKDTEELANRVQSMSRLVLTLQRVSTLPNIDLTQLRLAVTDLSSIMNEVRKSVAGNIFQSFGRRISEGITNFIAGGNQIDQYINIIDSLLKGANALKQLQTINIKAIDQPLRNLINTVIRIGRIFKQNGTDLEQAAQGFGRLGAAIQTFGQGIATTSEATKKFADAIKLIQTALPTLTKGLAAGLRNGGLEKQFGAEGEKAAKAMLTGIQETWEIKSPSRVMQRYAVNLFDGLKVGAQRYPFAALAGGIALAFTTPLGAALIAGVAGIVPAVIGSFSKLASAVTGKLKEVGASLRQQGRTLAQEGQQELLSGGLLAFLQKGVVTSAANFDQTFNQIRIFGQLTGDALKNVENELLKFSALTIFNPQQTADAFLGLQKAGFDTASALKSLKSVGDLATAGNVDLAKSSELVVTSLSIFKLKAEDSARVVDLLVKASNKSVASVQELGEGLGNVGAIASQFGLSIEQTVGILGIFNDNGIKGAEAGTQLKSVLAGITRPTAEVRDTFRSLGVSLTDAKGKFKDFNTIINDLGEAMNGTRTVTVKVSGVTKDQAAQLELLKKAYASAGKQVQSYQIAAITGATTGTKAAQSISKYQAIQANASKAINAITGSQATTAAITTQITRSQAANFEAVQKLAGSFGGTGLSVLLAQGDDALKQYIEEFEKLPGAAEIATEQMKTFKGTMESFKGSVETLVIKALRPLLNDVIAPLIDKLTVFVNKLADLPEPVLKIASGFALLVAGFTTVSGALKLFGGTFETVIGTVIQASGSILQFANIAFFSPTSLVAGIASFGAGVAAAIPIIAAFGAAVYVGINIFQKIQKDFETNTGGIRYAVEALFGSIRTIVESTISIVGNTLGIIGGIIGGIGDSIRSTFDTQFITDALRAADRVFSSIARTLEQIKQTIDFVKLGLEAISGVSIPAAATPTAPAVPTSGIGSVAIKAGDTYTALAEEHGTTVEELKKLNNNQRLIAGVTQLKVPVTFVPTAPPVAAVEKTVKETILDPVDQALYEDGKINLALAKRAGAQISAQLDPLEETFRRISTTSVFKSIFGDADLTSALNTLKKARDVIVGIGATAGDLVKLFQSEGLVGILKRVGSALVNLIPLKFDINLRGIADGFTDFVSKVEKLLGIGSGVSNFFKNLFKGFGTLKVDLTPITKGVSAFFDNLRKFDAGKFIGDVLTRAKTAFSQLGSLAIRGLSGIVSTIVDVFSGKLDLGKLLSDFFTNAVDFVKNIDLKKIATNAFNFVSGIVSSLVTAVRETPLVKSLEGAFAALGKIDIGKVLREFFGIKEGEDSGIGDFLTTALKDIEPTLTKVKGFLDTTLTPVITGISNGISLLVAAFTNNLTPEQQKQIDETRKSLTGFFDNLKKDLEPVLKGIDTVIGEPLRKLGGAVAEFIGKFEGFKGGAIEGIKTALTNIGAGIAALVGGAAVGIFGGLIDGINNALPKIGDAIVSISSAIDKVKGGDIGGFFRDFASGLGSIGGAILDIPVGIVDAFVKLIQTLTGNEATGIRPTLDAIGAGITDFVTGIIRQFDNFQREIRKTILDLREVLALVKAGTTGDYTDVQSVLTEQIAFRASDQIGKTFNQVNLGEIDFATALGSLKMNINGTIVDITDPKQVSPAYIAKALGLEQREGLGAAFTKAVGLSDTKALKFLLPIIAQPEFKDIPGVSKAIAQQAKNALEIFRKEGDASLLDLTLPALINLDPKDLSVEDKASLGARIKEKLDAAIASGDLAAIQALLPIAPQFGVATDPVALKKQVTDAIVAALKSGDSAALALSLQLAPTFGIDPKTLTTNFNDALTAAFAKGDAKGVETLIQLAPQFGLSKEDLEKKYKQFLKDAQDAAINAKRTGGGEGTVPEATTANLDILKLFGLDKASVDAALERDKKGLQTSVDTIKQSIIALFTPKEGESYDAPLPLEAINLKASDTEIDAFVKKLVDSGIPATIALKIRNGLRDAIKAKQATDANFSVNDPNAINVLDLVTFKGLSKEDVLALPADARDKLRVFGISIADDVYAGFAGSDSTVLTTTAADAGKNFKTGLETELEVHSPSAYTERIGEYLIEGLTLGLTNTLPNLDLIFATLNSYFSNLEIQAAISSANITNSIIGFTLGAQPYFDAGVAQIYLYQEAWLNLEVILIRISQVVFAIANATRGIAGAFGVTVPPVPPPPGKAAGGGVNAHGIYRVKDRSDKRPELISVGNRTYMIPGQNGTVIAPQPGYAAQNSAYNQATAYNNNSQIAITINPSSGMDEMAIGRAVVDKLRDQAIKDPLAARLIRKGRV